MDVAYEVQPTSPRWGVFERGGDEPVIAGIGSRDAAMDLCRAMNWAAADRRNHDPEHLAQGGGAHLEDLA
jgi:hypothetical protein